MRKVLAVVRREFIERLRTKGFWIATILGPVFFAAIILLPALLTGMGGIKRIVVVDETASDLGVRIATALDASRSFDATWLQGAGGTVDSLTREVGAKTIDGFLILPADLVDRGSAEYRASNVSAIAAIGELEGVLRQSVMGARLEREGVDPKAVERASVRVELETRKISRGRTTGETGSQSFALAYIMAMILYMAILLYGMNVMNSVLEEKTSRIVEVLVSSLRPMQLLSGKLIGVGAVSLFQFLIWGGSIRVLLSQRGALMSRMGANEAASFFQLPPVPMSTVAVFVFYFIGGFLLYSSMYAAVGAMSSNFQEAQQGAQPVAMLLVVSLISMFAMLNNPGSSYAVVLSLIPFTAPIAMPVRWAAGSLPLTEVLASMVMLALGIVAVIWVASRIYRIGILMTGKRPSLRELMRWVKTA